MPRIARAPEERERERERERNQKGVIIKYIHKIKIKRNSNNPTNAYFTRKTATKTNSVAKEIVPC